MRMVILPSWYPSADAPYAGAFFRSIALAIAAEGHDVTVLYPELRSLFEWRISSGLGELLESQDGPLRELRWRGFRWWPRERHGVVAFTSAARRLFFEYVQRFGPPDVVHAHVALPAGAAAARLVEAWDVPYLLSEQAGPFDMFRETLWQRRQLRKACASAGAVSAVSAAERAAMQAAGIEREIEVIPNTLDPVFVESPPRRVAPPAGGARFLTIAGMRPGKGLEDVVRAFEAVAAEQPDATLTLAGDGELRPFLELLVEELGLERRVRFAGLLRSPADVREALLAHDVFVLASHGETFGVVLIEALACGRPVVATRCGGPEEIVHDGNGRLVAVRDVEGLAAAMGDVWRRRAEYDAAAIHADCLARFGPKAVARRFVALLERVVTSHPRSE